MISVLLLISTIIPMDMSKTHKELENNESFNIKLQKLLNSSKTSMVLVQFLIVPSHRHIHANGSLHTFISRNSAPFIPPISNRMKKRRYFSV